MKPGKRHIIIAIFINGFLSLYLSLDKVATAENKVNSKVPLYYFGGKMIWGRDSDVKEKRKFVLKKPLKEEQDKPREVIGTMTELETRWGKFFYINYSEEEFPIEIVFK